MNVKKIARDYLQRIIDMKWTNNRPRDQFQEGYSRGTLVRIEVEEGDSLTLIDKLRLAHANIRQVKEKASGLGLADLIIKELIKDLEEL